MISICRDGRAEAYCAWFKQTADGYSILASAETQASK